MASPLPDPATRPPRGPAPYNSEPPARHPESELRHARFLPATGAEGPGIRAALWLQGCGIRCPGCFNPHLWSPRGGTGENPSAAAARFVEQALRAGAEGLTLLGGEPFEQAAAAAVVAQAFQAAGLGVMTFTGYAYADLRRWAGTRADIADLLGATDLLADGPYLSDRPERNRPWVGSTNQGLHALSSRYRHRIPGAADDGGDQLEVRIGPDGSVAVNGWAETAQLEYLLDGLDRPLSSRSTRTAAAASGRAPARAVSKEAI